MPVKKRNYIEVTIKANGTTDKPIPQGYKEVSRRNLPRQGVTKVTQVREYDVIGKKNVNELANTLGKIQGLGRTQDEAAALNHMNPMFRSQTPSTASTSPEPTGNFFAPATFIPNGPRVVPARNNNMNENLSLITRTLKRVRVENSNNNNNTRSIKRGRPNNRKSRKSRKNRK